LNYWLRPFVLSLSQADNIGNADEKNADATQRREGNDDVFRSSKSFITRAVGWQIRIDTKEQKMQ
jgi:hypothetical protein